MDTPSSPGTLSLGPAVAAAWGRSSVTARVLLVAWAVLPFAIIVPTLALKAQQDVAPVIPPSRALNVIQTQRLAYAQSAKSAVTALVPVMAACHKKTRDFTQCVQPEQLAPYGADLSTLAAGISQPGKAAVVASMPDTYSVEAGARTGGAFSITLKQDGTVVRTCSTPGVDACGPDGTW